MSLGASRRRPRPGKRKRQEEDEAEAEVFDDEPSAVDRMRVKVVGGLLLLAAAGFGLLAWRPGAALSAFDGAPWLQLALGALALGLALIPGWQLTRNLVRIVLILAAFALFPLAGILFAQGERGAALIALGSAWLIVSGLAALLPRRLGWAGLIVAALPVAAGGYGVYRFGRAQASEAEQRIQEWTTGERRFTDDALGLTLDAPEGWVLLKPGNPLVKAPKDARVTLALTRHGGGAYLVTEPAPRAVATADQYLDRLAAAPSHRAGRLRAAPARERGRRQPHRAPARGGLERRRHAHPRGGGRGARRLDGLRARRLDARGDGVAPERPRRPGARLRGARPARGAPEGRGGRGGGRGPAPLGPGGRAADVPERGARSRARPGLPPLALGARRQHQLAV